MECKGKGDSARQGYNSRSLVVFLEVAGIDWLELLDLIHALEDCYTPREYLLDDVRTTPVGLEFASAVREVNSSQDQVAHCEAFGPDFLLRGSGHPLLIALSMVHRLQSMLVDQVQLGTAVFDPFSFFQFCLL